MHQVHIHFLTYTMCAIYLLQRPGIVCFEERIEQCCGALREELRAINRRTEERVQHQLQKAVNNLAANIRYQFLEGHGPRRRRVTHNEPLVPR